MTSTATHVSQDVVSPLESKGREQRVARAASDRLPAWIWLPAIALATLGLLSVNPLLTAAAVLLLTFCAQLLWRTGEPPVLLFACSMQWLQAAGIIIYTDAYGLSLAEAGWGLPIETATWLSLGAILALALGMRVALIRAGPSQRQSLVTEAFMIDVRQAFVGYLGTFVVGSIAGALAFAVLSLSQLIYPFIALKWVGFFILAYCVLEQRRGYGFLVVAATIEFVVGLLGYFAGFKSVFFVLLVVTLSSPRVLQGKRLVSTVLIALILFATGVIWSAIKMEYRDFQNQGSGEQTIAVSAEESAAKLSDLVRNFSWSGVSTGLEAMMLRVSYVQWFGMTLVNVPDAVPYEKGALWFGAVKHIVTPRVLFPDKEILSDSKRTAYYTGVQVSGDEEGTSIGIGYVGESYIDFGPVLMFVPIFLLGAFYGAIYRLFAIRTRRKLIGTAIAAAILIFGAYTIETSNIKLLGGNTSAALVLGALYVIFGGAYAAWLRQRSN